MAQNVLSFQDITLTSHLSRPMKKLALALICTLSMASVHAGYLYESGANTSFATAQNVNGGFSLDADAGISNSTTWAHASLIGTGDNNAAQSYDYYRFSMGAGGVIFDIDFGMYDLDSWITVYDSNAALVGYNDDGGIYDAGTQHSWDSYMQLTLAAGDYVVAVSSYLGQYLLAGQDYVLHISVENLPAAEVPEPGGLLLLGVALAGLALSRKRA